MKHLIHSTNFLWPHHYSEVLDYGIQRVRKGDIVYASKCDGRISYCAPNPLNSKVVCRSCVKLQNKLSENFPEIRWITLSDAPAMELPTSTEQLQNTTAAIFNTAPYLCKHTTKKLKTDYNIINSFLSESIKKYEIDNLVLWNGRRISEGDGKFHQLAEHVKVTSIITASGSLTGFNTYLVFDAPKIHSMPARKEHIEEFRTQTGGDSLEEMSQSYFAFASGSKSIKSLGLSTYQNKFKPITCSEKYDYFIGNGTFVEFYGHDGWELDFGNNFNDLVQIILDEILSQRADAKIVVRWHPNLRNVSRLELQKIKKIVRTYRNVKFILPQSNVSTHALLRRSKVCFSVGSSIAIEASKLGIDQVYLVGRNYFEDLEAFTHIRSRKQLHAIVEAGQKTPRADVNLFGAYMGHRKVNKIQAVQIQTKQKIVTSTGVVLSPPVVARIALKIWSFGLKYIGPLAVRVLR